MGESDDSLVMVHDVARCFIPEELILNLYEVAFQYGAASAALPVADSLVREVRNTFDLGDPIDRSLLWQIQTPQVFMLKELDHAHREAESLSIEATDDAQLVRRRHPVRRVLGHPLNFKITTTADLEFARVLYKGVFHG